MAKKPNILFIMADQLRADYLGCNGHPTIRTPNIDALAARGVNFTRAYCQAPVCGPSRMSFYTGRYASSHGASYNNVPLRVDERTLGDYLRPEGYRVALVGKTHMRRDVEGMQRLGVDPDSSRGVLISECGFEPYERDDGLHPDQSVNPDLRYNEYLRSQGYESHNPWHDFANSAEGDDGEVLSGWSMRNCHLPARVREEDSETAYTTRRAMDFISESEGEPWCLHLSYIKPHWPYMAPAPYHELYGVDDVLPAARSKQELEQPHPVVGAFMKHPESESFARDEVRERVIPAYMGLITQLDDHIGRLMAFLEARGELDNTLVVLTSDHGDYLGDHWLGEKELFHEASVAVPMIVVDPSTTADATRGQRSERLVEAIDLVPTFVDYAGGGEFDHILEGRSLKSVIEGASPTEWRRYAFSECDYAWRPARLELGLAPDQANAWMVTDGRWKYVHYEHFQPQLFDLAHDPDELNDLGNDEEHRTICRAMEEALYQWCRERKSRITVRNSQVSAATGSAHKRGYLFGIW
ncbi:phosphonate monoester hydrolase [Marinobacterium nitratireducens]|uniref:Phosphonate monoester hydrolase n=1 Tax=Marinobacterium nitratireducens TaxID=518897 RepID=A0A917ZEE0_9GAMM|nr:alkaline phosphatase family protein [Marinobacterium nitratireducens]GGO81800.1 phosphonate monoester hydrolase [Marinobacterium nitratireducens]